MVEGDTYWVFKHSCNICDNEDEATKGIWKISKRVWAETFHIKMIVDDVLLYRRIS